MDQVEGDVGLLEDLQFQLMLIVLIRTDPEVQACAQSLAGGLQVIVGGALVLLQQTLIDDYIDLTLKQCVSIIEGQALELDFLSLIKLGHADTFVHFFYLFRSQLHSVALDLRLGMLNDVRKGSIAPGG